MMDPFPWDLVVLVVLLVAHRTVVPSLRSSPAFWTFQAITVGAAVWFAVYGVIGTADVPIVKVLVPGLLIFHAIQNIAVRSGGKNL